MILLTADGSKFAYAKRVDIPNLCYVLAFLFAILDCKEKHRNNF